jgi:iron complex outermembrane receptor protein
VGWLDAYGALDRIEVLRDGASALYGTDAIGGVINFITKQNLQGGSITLQAERPQHAGGKSSSFNIAYGFGSLADQGFNVLAVLDVQKQAAISATQRAFGSTGNIPSGGIAKSSSNTDPGNYYWSDGTSDGNGGVNYYLANAAAPNCSSNPFIFSNGNGGCRYDYTKWVDLLPESQRTSAMLKGTLKIDNDTQAGVSYFATNSVVKTKIAPVPYAGYAVDPTSAFYPGNGITASPGAIDPTQELDVYWRAVPAGGRQGETSNFQQRLLFTLDGFSHDWDYSTGLSYNENRINDRLTGGYTNDALIAAGIYDGSINPFGAQTDATQTYISNAVVSGVLQRAKGETWTLDGHASREVGDWFNAGRQTALAVGAELRHEKFSDVANTDYASLVVASTGFDPNTDAVGSRTVAAAYTELNVPITKTLDVTGALRVDHYSDFGTSVNPKVSMRFQPVKDVLFRSSYTTGFRAPSLYELHAPVTYTNTANSYNDPLLCPGGVASGANQAYCGTQFILQAGGNPKLKPEKSKSFTIGVAFEPIARTTVGLDFWWIRLQNSISALPEDLIFADPTKYAGLFNRNVGGTLSVSGSDCPGVNCGYITDTNANLGGTNTNGVDLSVDSTMDAGSTGKFHVGYNGTYVAKYEYQQEEGGAWLQNAGVYSGGSPVFRWQHTLDMSWNKGDWTVGLVNHFKSGYTDQNDPNQVEAAYLGHQVSTYLTWDTYATWVANKAWTVTAGVHNLADKAPPFSNQGATFQQGYDPRYTDPTGRSVYARATFSF